MPAIILKLLIGTIIPIGKEHKDNKKWNELKVIIEDIYKFLITSQQYGIDEILLSTQESNSLSIGPVTIS